VAITTLGSSSNKPGKKTVRPVSVLGLGTAVAQAFIASALGVTEGKFQTVEAIGLVALEAGYRRLHSTQDAVEQHLQEAGCRDQRVVACQTAESFRRDRKRRDFDY
jgi:hypothetical protein